MQRTGPSDPPAGDAAVAADPGHRERVEAAKAVLRTRIRTARRRRPPAERADLARGLCEVALQSRVVAAASVVACYLDGPAEPGTGPLRAALAELGTRVLLPVVASHEGEPVLEWAWDDGSAAPGPYETFPEPTGPRLGASAVAEADVVLVPALAVDTLGRRLGQGGGYYDRALSRARLEAPVVAVVHDDELLDADVETVPCLRHDRRVDAVLTPSRWVAVRP